MEVHGLWLFSSALVCYDKSVAVAFAFALQNTLHFFFFFQARMRRNIPESDLETIVRKLLTVQQSLEAIRDAQALLLQAYKHAHQLGQWTNLSFLWL